MLHHPKRSNKQYFHSWLTLNKAEPFSMIILFNSSSFFLRFNSSRAGITSLYDVHKAPESMEWYRDKASRLYKGYEGTPMEASDYSGRSLITEWQYKKSKIENKLHIMSCCFRNNVIHCTESWIFSNTPTIKFLSNYLARTRPLNHIKVIYSLFISQSRVYSRTQAFPTSEESKIIIASKL